MRVSRRVRLRALALNVVIFRSVFFEDVEVHYSGSPIILTNVTFINCTFVMDNGTNARALGLTLLASAKITFRTES